ncbi:MAG: hypothetical protein WCJ66_17385 [Verrucomicrobiota bacterium]
MKLEEHPLWPTLMEWAKDSPLNLVPWAPRHEFQQNVDLAALVDPIWGHEEGKTTFYQIYQEAAALGKALVGGVYDRNVHAMLYRISAHPLGRVLSRAAWVANSLPAFWDDFVPSARLDGFVSALEAWAADFMQEGFDGMAELPWVIKNVVGNDEVAADFWLTACQQNIGDAGAYLGAVSKIKRKVDDAANKKKERNRIPRTSEFKDALQCLWVPAALWRKSTNDIVVILAPRERQTADAIDRVNKDISDLGFTASHRPLP